METTSFIGKYHVSGQSMPCSWFPQGIKHSESTAGAWSYDSSAYPISFRIQFTQSSDEGFIRTFS